MSCASCGGAGALTCQGCGHVQYCSRECQRGHWKVHREVCKVCVICFEPKGVSCGCGCRGGSEFAHPECLATAARYRYDATGDFQGWLQCRTCKQVYAGQVRFHLAKSWYDYVTDRPVAVLAARNIASLHSENGDSAMALSIFESIYAYYLADRGPTAVLTLFAQVDKGATLANLGREEEARSIVVDAVEKLTAHFGSKHAYVLQASVHVARLDGDEALRGIAEVQTRLFGAEHCDTLDTLTYLSEALYRQGKLEESKAIGTRLDVAFTRILGPKNPRTLQNRHNLSLCSHTGDQ